MKSLLPKGAKSIFDTSEKNAFVYASLYPRLWKLKIEFTMSSFCSLYSDQKCEMAGGKLNNVMLLVTRF